MLHCPDKLAISISVSPLILLFCSLTVAIHFKLSFPCVLFVAIFLYISIHCHSFFASLTTPRHISVTLISVQKFGPHIFAYITSSSFFAVFSLLPFLCRRGSIAISLSPFLHHCLLAAISPSPFLHHCFFVSKCSSPVFLSLFFVTIFSRWFVSRHFLVIVSLFSLLCCHFNHCYFSTMYSSHPHGCHFFGTIFLHQCFFIAISSSAFHFRQLPISIS